jgi:hypothetical protein
MEPDRNVRLLGRATVRARASGRILDGGRLARHLLWCAPSEVRMVRVVALAWVVLAPALAGAVPSPAEDEARDPAHVGGYEPDPPAPYGVGSPAPYEPGRAAALVEADDDAAAPVAAPPPVAPAPVAPPYYAYPPACATACPPPPCAGCVQPCPPVACAPACGYGAPQPPLGLVAHKKPGWQYVVDPDGTWWREREVKKGSAGMAVPGLILWLGTYVGTAWGGFILDGWPGLVSIAPFIGPFISAGIEGSTGHGGSAALYALSGVTQISGFILLIAGAAHKKVHLERQRVTWGAAATATGVASNLTIRF